MIEIFTPEDFHPRPSVETEQGRSKLRFWKKTFPLLGYSFPFFLFFFLIYSTLSCFFQNSVSFLFLFTQYIIICNRSSTIRTNINSNAEVFDVVHFFKDINLFTISRCVSVQFTGRCYICGKRFTTISRQELSKRHLL